MTISELQSFWADTTVRAEARKAAYFLVAGIILGTIAPYDSSNVPYVWVRYLYWISLGLLNSVISGPVAWLCLPYFARTRKPSSLAFLAFSMLVSLALFPVVIFAEIYLSSPHALTFDYAFRFLSYVGGWDFVAWFGQVAVLTFVVMLAVTVANHLLAHRAEAGQAVDPETPTPAHSRFFARVPNHLGRELLCLSMEDHYLRVVTTQGDTLLLLRMRDALAELEDYPGFQVHRSHWVAENAIDAVKRDGRRHVLQLKDAREIPVSRSFVESLKERGLA